MTSVLERKPPDKVQVLFRAFKILINLINFNNSSHVTWFYWFTCGNGLLWRSEAHLDIWWWMGRSNNCIFIIFSESLEAKIETEFRSIAHLYYAVPSILHLAVMSRNYCFFIVFFYVNMSLNMFDRCACVSCRFRAWNRFLKTCRSN